MSTSRALSSSPRSPSRPGSAVGYWPVLRVDGTFRPPRRGGDIGPVLEALPSWQTPAGDVEVVARRAPGGASCTGGTVTGGNSGSTGDILAGYAPSSPRGTTSSTPGFGDPNGRRCSICLEDWIPLILVAGKCVTWGSRSHPRVDEVAIAIGIEKLDSSSSSIICFPN